MQISCLYVFLFQFFTCCIRCCRLRFLIFSISAGLNKDFFLARGDNGGVPAKLDNVEADVVVVLELWEEDKLSKELELSKARLLGASCVSVKRKN